MPRYSPTLKLQARQLRKKGFLYSEIQKTLNRRIPKNTLSYWCKGVRLPSFYTEKVKDINIRHLQEVRKQALVQNKIKREQFLHSLDVLNEGIVEKIQDKDIAKIALAMLCLGEASKYATGRKAFTLGNSDHRIITLFLEWLKFCFNFDVSKVRCTLQCRADQDILALEAYWREVTGIPKQFFYKARIDPRTVGKPTKNKNYKGVLRIDYFSTKVHLELESLAQLIYNRVLRARSLAG